MSEQQPARLPMPLRAIAVRYDVDEQALRRWTKSEGFPAPVENTKKQKDRWDPDQVDAWMKLNNPGAWAYAQPGDNPLGLPDLPDDTLLDAVEFGKMLGFLRPDLPEDERPVKVTTLRSYEARGYVPGADRYPGDGGDPEVENVSWYWSTVREHIRANRRKVSSIRKPAGGDRAAEASR